jgi:hypothetical protein
MVLTELVESIERSGGLNQEVRILLAPAAVAGV